MSTTQERESEFFFSECNCICLKCNENVTVMMQGCLIM